MRKLLKHFICPLLLLFTMLLSGCDTLTEVGVDYLSELLTETAENEQSTSEKYNTRTTARETKSASDDSQATESAISISEDGTYTSKDDVALYIHTYNHLPDNFITKKEAEALGWSSKKGNLWDVAPGMSIGGDHFGNYEGQLPEAKGRSYKECDIDYEGGYRGGIRIIFSNDGLIYYTDDHYNTFTLLYE